MIGRLRGLIAHKQPPQLLLDVAGVGYELEAPMSTFYELPAIGEEALLHTHLAIRDDAHTLFGFHSLAERELFRHLIKISGVGPKLALTLLSGISPEQFIRCIDAGDTATLVRLPGVGKKTAERLIVELRDRLAALPTSSSAHHSVLAPPRGASRQTLDPAAEAVDALIALGYKAAEASRMIRAIEGSSELSTEELIRSALRQAVKL